MPAALAAMLATIPAAAQTRDPQPEPQRATTQTSAPTARAPQAPTQDEPAPLLPRVIVGAVAPPIQAEQWLNGDAPNLAESARRPIIVLVFFATWSEPSRNTFGLLNHLQEQHSHDGVLVVGVTDEDERAVQPLIKLPRPAVRFRIALDPHRKLIRQYAEAAGVGFVPHAFVVDREGRIAWHGHPAQPELRDIVNQLVQGTYDREKARRLVLAACSADQLEALFRDAYVQQAWHSALLALDALLESDVPKQRLLRYKLTILLGDLGQEQSGRELVERILREYADDAAFLNSLASDILSDPRLYVPAPDLGLSVARAAYRASGGNDAAVADTYARALYVVGRLDLAIRVQQQAVQHADDTSREKYARLLDFYQRCQRLQSEVGTEP